jgi:pimeloyl-ACP methyl ester carboxylesterase
MISDSKRNPIVLIHGYSASGQSFKVWEQRLEARGYDVSTIHICSYVTLTNEVTIKDIAEGFDRALSIEGGLDPDQEFDAIVHSTGMLVIRAWLTTYSKKRRNRLKHLIGLAPATFGSPLAHKGRSWLGAMFKGNKEFGPDFLEAGDLVLDGLELGSKFTWDLAHKDLLSSETFYGPKSDTPYVFTFCGTNPYSGLARFVSDPGTDGTVRWAGCALNTRKISLDLTQQQDQRINFDGLHNEGIAPTVFVKDLNHNTIMSNPSKELVDAVCEALQFSAEQNVNNWYKKTSEKLTSKDINPWQQFIVRAVDERDDPIPDYYIQVFTQGNKNFQAIENFGVNVHTYSRDKSLRCFYVNLKGILNPQNLQQTILPNLEMRVIASSGSQLIDYLGIQNSGDWDAQMDISYLLRESKIKLFWPFTTTLIELRLNREPRKEVAQFLQRLKANKI